MARASGSYPEGRWFDSTRRYHFLSIKPVNESSVPGGRIHRIDKQGRIAQLGEHLPYKQGVIGSNPVAPTITVR